MLKKNLRIVFDVIFPSVVWGALPIIIIKYLCHPIHDGDTWWHLANGRFMIETGSFLRNDVFSHTLFNARWINFEWLSEIAMAAVVKMVGLSGLYAAKVALGMSAMGLLVGCLFLAGGRGPNLFILTWAGYQLLQTRLCTRVELVSLNMLPLFALLVLSLPHLSEKKQKRLPFIFCVLMIIWCNTHGGFVMGMILLMSFNLGARWAGWPSTTISVLDRAVTLALLSILINPYGPYLVEPFIQHLIDFKIAGGLIAEWEKPGIISTPLYWSLFLAGSILTLIHLLKRKKISYFWIPAFVTFAILSSSYFRSLSLLAFVALPFLAAHIPSIKMLSLRRSLWIFCLLILIPERKGLVQPIKFSLVDSNSIPEAAAAFVKHEGIKGTLYNSYGYGGYLEWALGPQQKVFMDGRYIFYPLLIEIQDLMMGRKVAFSSRAWATTFDHYGIDFAITKYEPLRLVDSQLAPFPSKSVLNLMFPRSNWALVYWDDASLIFLKRISRFSSEIAKHEYKNIQPYDLEGMVNELAKKKLNKNDAINDLLRHEKETGPSSRRQQIHEILKRI